MTFDKISIDSHKKPLHNIINDIIYHLCKIHEIMCTNFQGGDSLTPHYFLVSVYFKLSNKKVQSFFKLQFFSEKSTFHKYKFENRIVSRHLNRNLPRNVRSLNEFVFSAKLVFQILAFCKVRLRYLLSFSLILTI